MKKWKLTVITLTLFLVFSFILTTAFITPGIANEHEVEINELAGQIPFYCAACGYSAHSISQTPTGGMCKVLNCAGQICKFEVKCNRDGSHISNIIRCVECGAVYT